MPGEVDRPRRIASPRCFARRQKREPLACATTHFHDMRDHVNGAAVTALERERAARRLVCASQLAVFLEPEGIHREHGGVTGHGWSPLRQYLRDPVAQHATQAEAEIE